MCDDCTYEAGVSGYEEGYEDGAEAGWKLGFAAALDELESRVLTRPEVLRAEAMGYEAVMEIVDKMKGLG